MGKMFALPIRLIVFSPAWTRSTKPIWPYKFVYVPRDPCLAGSDRCQQILSNRELLKMNLRTVTENDRPFVKTCSKFDKQDQICYNEELSWFPIIVQFNDIDLGYRKKILTVYACTDMTGVEVGVFGPSTVSAY